MTLSIFNEFMKQLESIFKSLEKIIVDNFNNPILWGLIIVVIISIVAWAYNYLSR